MVLNVEQLRNNVLEMNVVEIRMLRWMSGNILRDRRNECTHNN